MVRKGSESHTGRNIAIVTGLAAGAAALGYGINRTRRLRREVRPDLVFDWSDTPFVPDVEKETAKLDGFGDKAFRRHLAVLTVDKGMFDDHLSRSEGRVAVAVRGEDGDWRMGAARDGQELSEISNTPNRRAIAFRVGNTAIQEVQLGILDEERFVPFDTEALDISDARTVRHEYPGIQLLDQPPAEVVAPLPGAGA